MLNVKVEKATYLSILKKINSLASESVFKFFKFDQKIPKSHLAEFKKKIAKFFRTSVLLKNID